MRAMALPRIVSLDAVDTPLEEANRALVKLKRRSVKGAKVLRVTSHSRHPSIHRPLAPGRIRCHQCYTRHPNTDVPRLSNPESHVSREVGSRLTNKRVVLRTRSESCR